MPVHHWGDERALFKMEGSDPVDPARYPDNHNLKSYAGGHVGFLGYLVTVDAVLVRTVGLSLLDLPDHTWRMDYDARVDPYDAISSMAEDSEEERLMELFDLE